ncbi:hypothetical protein [uncultured Enterococcus sp.]|uniref:hypothetical protein n=1 Tax=uncultured Enterococcus sp. TaxID=167972 RepID=UPI002AA8AAAC|nr:hypothetical protein [uncultured Enterococcus sp.]
MAKEKKETAKKETAKKETMDKQAFIQRKLMVLNKKKWWKIRARCSTCRSK